MKRLTSALALLPLFLFALNATAQLQTGNIYGRVQTPDAAVLPGVTVTLSGGGAPQVFVTDGQGNFRFINLSPGTYAVTAELANYGRMTRSGITVSVGRNADVTLTLSASMTDVITVTTDAPLLDTRKTGTGVNVGKVDLEKIPNSRDPWSILGQAPGVQTDRINVGGSQSGQQAVYVGKGSNAAQNTWNVDGVNVTDMGATGSSPLYYDFDSFEEMQVATGGSDPRIQTPGVQLNMVTKRGTNDVRGSARYFYTPGSMQAEATVPAEAQSYLELTNRINFVRDYGAEVGGPIWKDHLWFWGAAAENKISNQASQAPGVTGAFDNIILRDKNAKVNGQITSNNSAVGFYTFGDKVRNARNLSTTRPFEASWRQTGPTKVYKLEDTQIFGSSFYLTGMWSKVSGGFDLIPNGGLNQNIYEDANLVWHNSFLYSVTDRPQKQYRADGSKFFDVGAMNHELKFGFGYRSTPVASESNWPGPTNSYLRERSSAYCAARGVENADHCFSANFNRARVARYDERYRDLYVGDTILAGNLTIQAGLRYDLQRARNTASTAPGNPLLATGVTLPCTPQLASACDASGQMTAALPSLAFNGDARDLRWRTVTPRLGLTYALGADKKTLLRAAYNRYVDQMGATVNAASPLGYYSIFQFVGNDANNNHAADRNELVRISGFAYIDPANPATASSTIRLDYGMKPPHTDEIILGGERELFSDFSLGVNYTYRRYNDALEFRAEKTQGGNDFFTSADYVPVSTAGGAITDANGNVVANYPEVTVYDLRDPSNVPTFFVLRNRPDYHQTYNGLELTATKRLSHRWLMRGNVAYTDWKEHSGSGSYADPTPKIAAGACQGACNGVFVTQSATSGAFQDVFINSKWSFNLTGLYQLPFDFNLGASLTGRQGYPNIVRDDVSLPSGATSQVILHNPVGSSRFDSVYELDLRAAKDFRFFNRLEVTISADLFNAPNQRTILQRTTLASTDEVANGNFNRITELQSPRVWRLGARLTF